MNDATKIVATSIITFISGGLAGAFLTNMFAASRQRTDVALSLIKDTFLKWSQIRNICEKVLNRRSLNSQELDELEMVGDWFELIAAAYQGKIAQRTLFDSVDIREGAVRFAAIVTSAVETKFLQHDFMAGWPHLKRLREEELSPKGGWRGVYWKCTKQLRRNHK